jgi:hypothetical protein
MEHVAVASPHAPPRRLWLAVAIAAACAAVLSSSAAAAPGRPDTFGLTRLDDGLCALAGFPGADAAAEWLAGRLTHDEVHGGEIGSFVLTSVQAYCTFPNHLRIATAAVRSLLADQTPSTETSTDAVRALFAQQEAAGIALQLRTLTGASWSAANVRTLVGRICRDARSLADPVGRDLAPALPGATLSALPVVNALVGRTVHCRPALSAAGANYVSAAAFDYLVANTYPDLEPPVAVFTQIHGVRYTDHNTRVTFSWLALDRAGSVSSLVVYSRAGRGPWTFRLTLRPQPASAWVSIPEGYAYQLALQAVDDSGNRSSWAYSGVGVA